MVASFQAWRWRERIRAIDRHERAKPYPERYPINSDAIGIELMGAYRGEDRFESVTPLHAQALAWLLGDLYCVLRLGSQDVYRHPAVFYKNPGEARSAKW